MLNPFGEASNSLTASLIRRIQSKLTANDDDQEERKSSV